MERYRRILIVDKDPLVRINCRVILRKERAIVFACEDRESALEKVFNEQFDMVITDIRLPSKHHGLTTLQEMKLMQPTAEIVVTADEPSIWDARECIRLGAFGYIEKPLAPASMVHITRKTFDKNGWIVGKAHIDHFRDFIAPSPGKDNPRLYYKNGAWAKHLDGGLWEIGYDMKFLRPTDRICTLELSKNLSALRAGETYASVYDSMGNTYELKAPLTGTLLEINDQAEKAAASCIPRQLGADWLLWLARIDTKDDHETLPHTGEEGLIGHSELFDTVQKLAQRR